ncbi:unnamed protein product [Dovyalis caffra]|uniref:Uncharacterized protein n=1 Tax=Dovyalis caffra TaxID=77055 RepID=A0AAV1SH46_9ROSI|nr:unnamed protein product [Dovyalis caffra]
MVQKQDLYLARKIVECYVCEMISTLIYIRELLNIHSWILEIVGKIVGYENSSSESEEKIDGIMKGIDDNPFLFNTNSAASKKRGPADIGRELGRLAAKSRKGLMRIKTSYDSLLMSLILSSAASEAKTNAQLNAPFAYSE